MPLVKDILWYEKVRWLTNSAEDTPVGEMEQTRGNKMSEFGELLNEQLKNPDFKKEWDNLQPEMEAIRATIESDKTVTE